MLKKIFLFIPLLLVLNQCTLPQPSDIVPPTVAVVFPYEGAVISANINVNILAVDSDKIKKVWFYVDGVKIGEGTTAPYELPLSITGLTKKVNHVLMAAAEDAKGNTAYSVPVNFVVAETEDIIPPSVLIVNPQGGQVVEGIVNITAYAEDERSVQSVEFFIDGISRGSSSAYPYIYNWDTSNISDSTSHTIFAKASDGGGNTAISPVIQVTVYPRIGPAGDNTAPSALFLYPVAGSVVSGTVSVSVDLFDNESVTKTEFYVDGQLKTSQDNPDSPWIFNWNTAAQADTTVHSLYVKAFDAAGNAGTSGLMTVTVQ